MKLESKVYDFSIKAFIIITWEHFAHIYNLDKQDFGNLHINNLYTSKSSIDVIGEQSTKIFNWAIDHKTCSSMYKEYEGLFLVYFFIQKEK